MAFPYPDRPWTDGQTVKKEIGGREVVVAKYDASKNLWVHLDPNDDGFLFYGNACQITIDRSDCDSVCPWPTPLVEWCDAKNVQFAIDWLHYHVNNLTERTAVLEAKVKALEDAP